VVLVARHAFLAGKTQKIKTGNGKSIKSVASPFGLHSSLRQSGSRFAAVFRREAAFAAGLKVPPLQNNHYFRSEASLYLAATTKAKAPGLKAPLL
jgi:hypothetical protein